MAVSRTERLHRSTGSDKPKPQRQEVDDVQINTWSEYAPPPWGGRKLSPPRHISADVSRSMPAGRVFSVLCRLQDRRDGQKRSNALEKRGVFKAFGRMRTAIVSTGTGLVSTAVPGASRRAPLRKRVGDDRQRTPEARAAICFRPDFLAVSPVGSRIRATGQRRACIFRTKGCLSFWSSGSLPDGWRARLLKGTGSVSSATRQSVLSGRSSVTGSCIALDFISGLESLASSSTPQSERLCCSWLCGFWARADGAVIRDEARTRKRLEARPAKRTIP
jgi:hypothetical protein